ncbi:MAG: hypothetical protein ACOCZ6_04205 [Nanoarchaeota archaeon]
MVVAKRYEKIRYDFEVKADRAKGLQRYVPQLPKKTRHGGFFIENGGPLAEISYSINHKENSTVVAIFGEHTTFHYFKNGEYIKELHPDNVSDDVSVFDVHAKIKSVDDICREGAQDFRLPKQVKGQLKNSQHPEVYELLGKYLGK